ncbi:hypothetical protein [Novosphingobium lentum]|uniref:hypothetical protein n=1 Tax=Novosphingobium lentum TaxID=145287 RepID=UPI000AC58D52|nr:hypothetical protein [Novosphingobium lentum]
MSALPVFVDLAAIAEVLGELGNEVEQLGVSLCCDPAVAVNHMHALQAFDLIAQKQRGLAALLRAECPTTAKAALGLDELKVRLGSLLNPD